MSKILKTTQSAVYRRNKILKEYFVKAKFIESTLKKESVCFSVENYNTKICSLYKNLVETTTFKSNTNSKVFKIKHNMTYNSTG